MSSSPADWRTFDLTLVPLLLLSLLSLLSLLFFHPDVKKPNIANFTFNHRLHRPPRLLPFTLSVVIIVVVILSSSLRRQSKVGPGCFTNLPTARQQRQIPVCREGNLEPSLESSSSPVDHRQPHRVGSFLARLATLYHSTCLSVLTLVN